MSIFLIETIIMVYLLCFYMQYNQKLDLHSWKDSNITSLCSMKGHSRTVRCVLVGLITLVILMYCICSNHTYFYIWTSSHIQTFTKQLILYCIYKNFISFVSNLKVFLFFSDVSWSPSDPNKILSCSVDTFINLWDVKYVMFTLFIWTLNDFGLVKTNYNLNILFCTLYFLPCKRIQVITNFHA